MKEPKTNFRGRPRGRLGTDISGSNRLRGRPYGRLGFVCSRIGRVRGRPRHFGFTKQVEQYDTTSVLQYSTHDQSTHLPLQEYMHANCLVLGLTHNAPNTNCTYI